MQEYDFDIEHRPGLYHPPKLVVMHVVSKGARITTYILCLMIIDIAEEEGCSSNLHTEVLRYDSNVNIYHKLPKPREIIKP